MKKRKLRPIWENTIDFLLFAFGPVTIYFVVVLLGG